MGWAHSHRKARGLGWSTSKVSRYELGRSTLPLDEVEKVLDFYGVTDPERGQMLSLAREANERGWWEDYADALPNEYQAFIGLEAEAASAAIWAVEIIPGLLQTKDYAPASAPRLPGCRTHPTGDHRYPSSGPDDPSASADS
jgi:hypothetical protein